MLGNDSKASELAVFLQMHWGKLFLLSKKEIQQQILPQNTRPHFVFHLKKTKCLLIFEEKNQREIVKKKTNVK